MSSSTCTLKNDKNLETRMYWHSATAAGAGNSVGPHCHPQNVWIHCANQKQMQQQQGTVRFERQFFETQSKNLLARLQWKVYNFGCPCRQMIDHDPNILKPNDNGHSALHCARLYLKICKVEETRAWSISQEGISCGTSKLRARTAATLN